MIRRLLALLILPACLNAQAVVDSTTVTHEPAGFTRITSQPFSAATFVAGWAMIYNGAAFDRVSLLSDPGAPLSPPGFGRCTYPAGFTAGRAPCHAETVNVGSKGYRELYVRTAVRVSANWDGERSTVNKVLFFWGTTAGRGLTYVCLCGAGSAPLNLQVRTERVPLASGAMGNQNLRANLGSGVVSRGAWHVVEFLLTIETPGQRNGRLDAWLDNHQTHSVTGLAWGQPAWKLVQLSPTYGGTSGVARNTQTLDVDDITVGAR